VKFWDASALVPLLVADPTTRALQALAARDPDMLVWWGSQVECVSALARLEREAALDGAQVRTAYDRLDELARGWHEIGPGEIVRETAMRFLRVHPLRAADALQLAAAFVAAENRPSAMEVVTLDDRLAEAARKEGFVLAAV
jgi:predicted nucleic acid-binding protein